MSEKLLEVKNLKTCFYTEDGVVPAVNGVDFHVNKGETLGIVGESGCGKSVTSMSILRLIPNPPGKIVEGSIQFDNKDIIALDDTSMRQIRGNDISMIFQEPMTSLNPVFTIGYQIGEVLQLHQGLNKEEAKNKCVDLLKMVGIPRAEKIVDDFPHALSGGMRQRAMIAMALACNPKLLIADEPTTALDVTIQAQILDLMKKLQQDHGTSIMLITHDLGVVAEMADRVIVMYAGRIVEEAMIKDLYSEPLHPYTVGLMYSKPDIDDEKERLNVIPGVVPNLLKMPPGCSFNPRCDKVFEKCVESMPPLATLQNARKVRCWLYTESEVASNE